MKRFWDKANITEGCYNWIASKTKSGYGRFRINGKTELAHRIAYVLQYGIHDNKFHVLHKCNNSLCVRPDHLYLGTNKENSIDRVKAGTQKKTLTDNQVSEIRQLYNVKCNQYSLAKLFKVRQSTISRIITRSRRFHVK